MPLRLFTPRLIGRPPTTGDGPAMHVASQAVAAAVGFAYEGDVEHLGDPHRLYRRRAA